MSKNNETDDSDARELLKQIKSLLEEREPGIELDIPRTRGKHPHHRLTDLVIRQAGPGRHADGEGLYLYVRPSGSRSWMQRLVVHGKRKDRGLGSYPLVSLADARRKAEEHRRVARGGGDPFAVRAPKEAPTVRELWDAVVELRRKHWRTRATEAKWRRFFREYVEAPIGDTPVDRVTVDDVLDIVGPRWAGRGSAGWYLRHYLNQVMRMAMVREFRIDNPAANIESAMHRVTQVVQHHPSLPYPEAPAAMAAVRNSEADEAAILGLLFVVMTACRVGEVAGALWTEFDRKRRIWTPSAAHMKKQVERPVPLPVQADVILDRVRELARSGEFVFAVPRPRRGGVRPLTSKDFGQILGPLGFVDVKNEPISMHGFRRTFRTWGSEVAKARFEVLEVALAHLAIPTVQAYFDRENSNMDERRELMQAWADYVLPRDEDR